METCQIVIPRRRARLFCWVVFFNQLTRKELCTAIFGGTHLDRCSREQAVNTSTKVPTPRDEGCVYNTRENQACLKARQALPLRLAVVCRSKSSAYELSFAFRNRSAAPARKSAINPNVPGSGTAAGINSMPSPNTLAEKWSRSVPVRL